MRQIGELDNKKMADRFVSALSAESIAATLREKDDHTAALEIWVMDEDQVELASSLLAEFQRDPNASKFLVSSPAPKRQSASDRNRYIDARREIFGRSQIGKVTVSLIVLSVLASYASSLPGATTLVRSLYFSEYFGRSFPEIMDGEVWRLVTPIFLHGGVLHLLFNMLWLWQLGGSIERNEGPVYFLILAFVFAALCNSSQYLVSGPLFVGMSGVVYALLGYIWIMSRYQAGTRYALAPNTVMFMIVWMVICLVGIIPNVANTQHVAGFAYGAGWGFLRSGYLTTLTRRHRFKRKL